VKFSPATLLAQLDALETARNKPSRYVIALSGGLDSTVLANCLAETRERHGKSLLAVHVDHGLHPDSGTWTAHCRQLASALGIDFAAETVAVAEDGGGLEAAARNARYTALARHVSAGDWLLSAHHRDDQAETLLLNLMRGSGPAGLAGIGALSRFGAGWLARPLIAVPREALATYAARRGIAWLDDPSNRDLRFDRNYLRHEVLPGLERRWPGAGARLARSAGLAAEAAELLEQLADLDLASLGGRPERIDVAGLAALSPARQRNVLRRAIRRAGLPPPPAAQLGAVFDSVIPAKDDARPLVAWPGAEIRRYRGVLYVLPAADSAARPWDGRRLAAGPCNLGPGMGHLALVADAPEGLCDAVVARGLSLRCRRGGEKIRPAGHAHTRKLKKLLQEAGVTPWMRDRVPLVYADDGQLVAVADLWIAADAACRPGTAVEWRDRPPLA